MSTSTDDIAAAPGDEAGRLRQALLVLQQHQSQLGADVVARAVQPLQQRLAALTRPVPRLRQVSVLFVDIVDSTGLLQALDAEDSHAVLDGALLRFADAVQQQGGHVLRFMGDGLKAAFGLPEPGEDDAQRAVRAAMAVLAQAREHARAMRSRLGPLRFQVRIGLHTGPVALGAGAEDAQTLVGATVHLAARLEKVAEPGTLRVSHDTWRLVRGAFDFQVLPPLRVKGLADPVPTYQLIGERDRGRRASGRGIDGLDTALVGRAVPLATLDAAVRALAPGVPGQCVTVLGDAGLGKSRLRQALLQSLADPTLPCAVQVLPAQAWPETERAPWGLLRDLVLRHADLGGGEPAASALERLREVMLPVLTDDLVGDAPDEPPDRASPDRASPDSTRPPSPSAGRPADPIALARVQALAYAIGLLDPVQAQLTGLTGDARTLRTAVQGACLAWWRGLTRRQPVLLLLDDLHWADDASLDLLMHCWRELASRPLAIVALARPALCQRRPDWPFEGPRQRCIALDPLDSDAAEALIDALLGRMQPVPPLLRQALVQRSGGNPYYIEELVCMLIDSGALDVRGPVWQLRGDADALQRLPGTLAGVLQARIGQLDAVERLALQQAAVVGPLFDEPTLAAIDPAAPRALSALQALGLVVPISSGAWRFHHQLLQQAAYDSVPRTDREPWHGRVAAHLDGREDSPAQWVANHYEQAGNTVAAVRHYRRAALGETSRMPRTELRHAARRALALAPEADAAERWPLQLQEATCSSVLDDLASVNAAIPALRALAEALDDDGLRAEAERLALSTERPLWNSPERLAAVVELAERAHRRQPGERLPRMLGIYAWSLLNKERVQEARAAAERGIALAAEAGVAPPHQVLESAGIAAWKLGDLSAGMAHVETVYGQAAARGDASVQIAMLGNLAGMARTLGDRATWQQALDEAFSLTERSGLIFGLPLLRVRRAQLLQHDGQPDAAVAELRRGLAALPPSDRWYRITLLLAEGHAHLASGRSAASVTQAASEHSAARAAFEQALDGAVDAGMRAEARQGLVLTALAEGDAAAAMTHADALLQAMTDPEPGDATERPAQWLAVADARHAAGDASGAAQALDAAFQELMGQAGRIGNPVVRERFLDAVPHNRRIRQEAAQAGMTGASEPPRR